MVTWECSTNPREASGLDPEAVHNTVAIPIAFFGLLHPVIAVASMITSSISVITNSTRLGDIEL
ncbi:hypothetical protein CV102_24395 [Natronococcus pandeyae]|uniref:Uncharacterized protein n=1 Tax=Natronococcus pandeyae TaxID=2055836 RepID=A0A8J8TMY1_9EURY|nr:hypothetical protein CV102_24395 [Natronococcus pandeyae]